MHPIVQVIFRRQFNKLQVILASHFVQEIALALQAKF